MNDDPFGGRQPTSHERMTGLPWDASYQDGPAPWDVGRPQPAIVDLANRGGFVGMVLDVGCGTGENALLIASLGLQVLGVDVARTALAMARTKATERGIDADFATADAFDLGTLGRTFDTLLDCGMFHTCDTEERPRYVASLAAAAASGATLHVLCLAPGDDAGPHPVDEDDLRAAFADDTGWRIVTIEPTRLETTFHTDGAPALLARIVRT